VKKWWTSKTLWVNAIALAGSIALATVGMSSEEWAVIATTVLAVANIVLRLVTGEGIEGMEQK
jgi:hypothetical protein